MNAFFFLARGFPSGCITNLSLQFIQTLANYSDNLNLKIRLIPWFFCQNEFKKILSLRTEPH